MTPALERLGPDEDAAARLGGAVWRPARTYDVRTKMMWSMIVSPSPEDALDRKVHEMLVEEAGGVMRTRGFVIHLARRKIEIRL